MPTIGERIRLRRSALSLTQTDLAECVGYKKAAVSTWERGTATPPLNVIEEIAKALHTTSEYLLGYTEQPDDWETIAADLDIPSAIWDVAEDAEDAVRRYRLVQEDQEQEAAKMRRESRPPSAEPVLTSDEQDLIDVYRELNEPGKDAAMASVRGIAANPKFQINVAKSAVGEGETQAV